MIPITDGILPVAERGANPYGIVRFPPLAAFLRIPSKAHFEVVLPGDIAKFIVPHEFDPADGRYGIIPARIPVYEGHFT